ncbi:hypothetical protein AVEN_129620-1 [Araneus ventricosus]|uniref:Uncharacterized protein n=1 Tax=Araneus ventricosus TaxID=182803 RepID=A0A4Y2FP54_ARAVE|nr:hypothetical protein AVEN_129620-1 [Araneus ventricosus]
MASNEVNCFICENLLQESEVIEVKEKGLETFRKSSIRRKNNKGKLLEGLKSIVVHDVCRKRYNNEKLIAASLRRGSDVTTPQPQLRSTHSTFSFKDHCFLCEAEITAEFIAKQKQTYKLAPFPLSLFNDDGMRKCVKSSMYKAFEQHSGDINFGDTTGTCDNSQVPSHDSDEEEETETVFEQMYDGIENEEDRDESDNPIADDAEEISVCDVSIDTEDDELATPGPSRTAKRRRLR